MVIAARNEAKSGAAVEEIESAGGKALAVTTGVGVEASVQGMVEVW